MAGCPADYFDLDVSWHQKWWVAWGIPHGGLFQNALCLDSWYPETHVSFLLTSFWSTRHGHLRGMCCNRMVRVFGALCGEAFILPISYKHHASIIRILWIHHTYIINSSLHTSWIGHVYITNTIHTYYASHIHRNLHTNCQHTSHICVFVHSCILRYWFVRLYPSRNTVTLNLHIWCYESMHGVDPSRWLLDWTTGIDSANRNERIESTLSRCLVKFLAKMNSWFVFSQCFSKKKWQVIKKGWFWKGEWLLYSVLFRLLVMLKSLLAELLLIVITLLLHRWSLYVYQTEIIHDNPNPSWAVGRAMIWNVCFLDGWDSQCGIA